MTQRIIGHRGARDLWPENSRTGFRQVLTLDVQGVEFDLHPTADGRLVVIHDPTLDRTTDATGPVAARSAAELRDGVRLRGTEDEGVPLLEEVLDILAPSGRELHIELKADAAGHPYPGLEQAVTALVARRGIAAQCVLTSFSLEVLARLRQAAPQTRLLISLDARSVERQGGIDAVLEAIAALRIELVAVQQALLSERLDLFMARIGGPRLGAWVVNRPEDIARWRAAPIGLITTDRPDLFADPSPGQGAA